MWEWIKKKLSGDIFPIFLIVGAIGIIGGMIWAGFPLGIIMTMGGLMAAFAIVELIWKLTTKKTVSQEFWKWYCVATAGPNKYCKCPNCGTELQFPNKMKGNIFSIVFVTVILIITVGHLIIK